MIEDGYLVPAKGVRTEFIERKSRFITSLARVETVEEAETFLTQIRAEFPDATHNCAAYRIKTPLVERFFDDGEPGGTAGMPMLDVLKKEELFNVAVVVTRYFGGILLGAGGLVRAYSKGAADGVHAAGFSVMEKGVRLQISCNYAVYDRLQRAWEPFNLQFLNTDYGEQVVTEILLKETDTEVFLKKTMDVSAGSAKSELLEELFCPFQR